MSSLDPFSMNRVDASSILQTLPNELLDNIFTRCDRSASKSIRTLSRSLSIASNPHIFRDVHMCLHSRDLRKLIQIAATPYLRPLVQILTFHPGILPKFNSEPIYTNSTDFKMMARINAPMMEGRLKCLQSEYRAFKKQFQLDGRCGPHEQTKIIERWLEQYMEISTSQHSWDDAREGQLFRSALKSLPKLQQVRTILPKYEQCPCSTVVDPRTYLSVHFGPRTPIHLISPQPTYQ
jgi:hypothetical protein